MAAAADVEISVVDQSPIRKGGHPSEALRETVQLAQRAEDFGYGRYWVAEHHNSASFTGTSPEILIGQIAANTDTIRVGSGGVMLSHYSALKVAEQFRILDAFYPGRIDLGIGRAPGSDRLTAAALSHPRPPVDVLREFPQMVGDLLGFLNGTLPEGHPLHEITAQPGTQPDTVPEVWLLGSSDYSAQLPPTSDSRSASPTSSATRPSTAPEWRTCTVSYSSLPSTWTSRWSTSASR